MLKLIKCEFLKLKRKKFILFVILAAFVFPMPFSLYVRTPKVLEKFINARDAFDGLYNASMADGIQFLLPAIIGVIATILFFMERDNDTFKNIRTIPVTSTEMVFAKISVLFILSVLFSLITTIVVIICGYFVPELEVYGILYKLMLSFKLGVFTVAGTMPLIIIITFFSRNFIFSVLLSIFYTVLNMIALSLYPVLPKFVIWSLPTPLTTFWSAGDMIRHGMNMNLEELTTDLIPSTFEVAIILLVVALASFVIIDQMYKRRSE